MPIYPPRNEPIRKVIVLEKREFELEKCLRTKASAEKTNNKADLVRTAQLNLIKARLALLKTYRDEDKTDSNNKIIKKLESEFSEWEKKPIELIIEEYKE